MRSLGRALLTATLLWVTGSCASAAPDLGPDGVIVTETQLSALEAAAAKVTVLEQRLAALDRENRALRERMQVLEERAGILPFRPVALKPMNGSAGLPDALVVAEPGARGRRSSLKRHLSKTNGMVVAFWATWCKPCIADEELALLRKLRTQLRVHGVDLVSMAIDGLDKVQAHVKASRFIYPLWQKDQGHFDVLPERHVRSVGVNMPIFVVVSKDGQLHWFRDKALDERAVNELVTASVRLL